ncbi:MAG: hypothetical protein HY294_15930 [Candidatus Rokubacteria bacterium]|nr:hypothetical protein [Candidatus Rokubacteria bacterium]
MKVRKRPPAAGPAARPDPSWDRPVPPLYSRVFRTLERPGCGEAVREAGLG